MTFVDLPWTPVDEALPAFDVPVIAHNDMTQAMRITTLTDNDNGKLRWESWFHNKPTHWTPAPLPLPVRPDVRTDEGSLIWEGQL